MEVDDESISLTIKLGMDCSTRSNVTDSPSDTSLWTQVEKAVDGRYLYLVSVYIVDDENSVVAHQENIAVENQASEVIVNFDKSYNLKRGVHKLMVVANNSDHTINGNTYESGITSAWASGSYNDLMGNTIAASTDFISAKDIIQPLSLMKEIELHAGANVVGGELKRTFARIRIEVKNNSGTLPLNVNSVTFSDNFAQNRAYVFDDGSDRKYFGTTGAPVATSVDALSPFALDNDLAYKNIDSQASAVVFDGYILESKAAAGEPYTYTLDMTYNNIVSQYSTFSTTNSDLISNVNNLNVGNESYYLIYNTERGVYLSADEDYVTTASISDFESLAASNVWQITKSGNNYYLQNVNSGLYMQAISGAGVAIAMGTTQVAYSFSNTVLGYRYILLRSGEYEVGVNGYDNVVGQTYGDSRRFRFYKVTKTSVTQTGSINYNTPIVLTSIDPISQQSSDVTAIKRNDFINILVTISYNPEAGEFDLRVEDWELGGGNVEFN